MKHLLFRILVLCALCSPLNAEELLPVALDHQSVAFPLERQLVPLASGTRVEFTVEDDNGVPKKPFFDTVGFVLGEAHGVLFIEVPNRVAASIAKYRGQRVVKYQKISDAVPEEVAERKANIDNAVNLAPRMRRLTIELSVESETANGWTPGETLTFYDAVEHTWSTGKKSYYDATAIFHSARELEAGKFEVALIADPNAAFAILQAELQNRLTLEKSPLELPVAQDARCYITQWIGLERQRAEIPCRG